MAVYAEQLKSCKVVKVRNKQYKVNIDNQGSNNCRVSFVYNKKKFETTDYIPEWWNERAIPETRCPRVQLLSFFIIWQLINKLTKIHPASII